MTADGLYGKALDYLLTGMHAVPGFLSPLDAGLLLAVDLAQKGMGIKGDLAEIGVYAGRNSFLFSHLLRPGERVHGIDIFDINHPNPPCNPPDRFYAHAIALKIDLGRINLIKADSAKEAARVQGELGPGRMRLFHVDGDHRLMHILADAQTALAATAADGVIVFDDVFSFRMPEVTEGLLRVMRERTDFVPLALSPGKAYFCRPDLKGLYAAYMAQCLPDNLEDDVRRLLDRWVLVFSADKPVMLRYLDRIGLDGAPELHRHIQSLRTDFPLPP